MAGRKQIAITERQFAVLRLLWEHGPLTVRELRQRLPRGTELPYTTVLGLLQGMEKAGLVAHGAESPAHRYRPLVSEREATGHLLGDFLARYFRGSAERLVQGLVDARHLTPEDLREIEAKLAEPEAPPKRPRRKS
jgi:predicted transcriptional regulator